VTDLYELSLLDQAALVRDREVSPLELVDYYLARIESRNELVGAFVLVTADRARERARDLMSGAPPRGPLWGVPTAIKDLQSERGVVSRLGSAVSPVEPAGFDDSVVRRLRDAGMISLGHTSTPEFGLPCYTEPAIGPTARTPWDLSRGAGGSSGGAAAAVAAGLVAGAQGSDGGGSIRIPASCCGLVGLKVSRGRVSASPGADLTGLASAGPITRTVADAAALLDVMAGPAADDATWAAEPSESFLAAAARTPSRLRIGRHVDNVLGAPVHPDCRAAWESASVVLADLGHEVVDIPVPTLGELWEDFVTLWSVSAASLPLTAEQELGVRPLTRYLREQGRSIGAVRYARAVTALQVGARQAIAATAAFEAVLTPTLASPPAGVGALRDDADPARDFALQSAFTPYTAIYNMIGLPAISLPLHVGTGGLPIGIQLIGRPAGEAGLLALAAQLEQANPWRDRWPPIARTLDLQSSLND
jgi:amidase